MPSKLTRILAAILVLWLQPSLAASPSTSTIVAGPAGQQLDRYLSRLQAVGFSGVVQVSKDNEVILSKGYGLADREQGAAYTPDTVFDIGSITKQFTAAAILELEMAGKLSVGDSISKYFEAVPEDKQGITLHQLLTHTSGLQGDFGGDYEEMSREALVEKALASKLQSAPGARYDYSNAGYSLLGAIVEKVSGQPYERYLQQQLFNPAGMTKTGYVIPKWQPRELVHGYELDVPWGTPLDKPWAPDGPWWNLRSNGGLLSTVGDLYKWHQVLLGESVLSKQAKAKYFARHVAEDEEGSSFYGYGWEISQTSRNTQLISHNGFNGVLAADFQRYVDDGAVIIGGSAESSFQIFSVTAALSEMLFGGDIAEPPVPAKMDSAALDRYAGTYRLPAGGSIVVTAGKAGLNGGPSLVVSPTTRAAFEGLTGAVPDEVRTRLGNSEARLLSALEQTRQGIYDPLAAIYGVPLDSIKQRIPRRISQFETRLGSFQRFELLGTVVSGEQASTWVRFVYRKGAQVFEHLWQGSEVSLIRQAEGLGGSFFVAESGKELFSYNPRTLQMQRIEVEKAEGGVVTALVLHGPTGDLRAARQ